MLCVVALVLAACVIVPVAAVTILAVTGRQPSKAKPRSEPGAAIADASMPADYRSRRRTV